MQGWQKRDFATGSLNNRLLATAHCYESFERTVCVHSCKRRKRRTTEIALRPIFCKAPHENDAIGRLPSPGDIPPPRRRRHIVITWRRVASKWVGNENAKKSNCHRHRRKVNFYPKYYANNHLRNNEIFLS